MDNPKLSFEDTAIDTFNDDVLLNGPVEVSEKIRRAVSVGCVPKRHVNQLHASDIKFMSAVHQIVSVHLRDIVVVPLHVCLGSAKGLVLLYLAAQDWKPVGVLKLKKLTALIGTFFSFSFWRQTATLICGVEREAVPYDVDGFFGFVKASHAPVFADIGASIDGPAVSAAKRSGLCKIISA